MAIEPQAEDGRDSGPARRIPRWLRWSLRGLFTIGVTWIIADQLGVTLSDALALDRAMPDPDPIRIAASVLVLLAGFLLATRLWGWMVRDLGEVDPGVVPAAQVIMTANLGRYVPGKVWQIAGLALLSRRHGVSGTTGTLAGLLVQGFSLVAAGLWGAPALLAMATDGAGDSTRWAIGAGLVGVVLALGMVPDVVRPVFRLAFRIARRDPDDAPRTDVLFVPRWLGAHGILWGVYGIAFFLLLDGLGFPVPVGTATVAFAGAYFLGYLAVFAPAGIGVREGVLTALLHPELGLAAAPVAVAARIWMTVVELAPAGAFALHEAVRRPGGGPPAGRPDEERTG